MRLVVGYLVCVDSVSLSKRVTDAIFNSLALTFIIDLNKAWKLVCEIAFHLRVDDDEIFLNGWEDVKKKAQKYTGPFWDFMVPMAGGLIGFVIGGLLTGHAFWLHSTSNKVWCLAGGLLGGLVLGGLVGLWIVITCLNSKDLENKFNVKTGWWKMCRHLRRFCGWGHVESILAACAMFLIYIQQAQVVQFAYKTDVLPVARDVCTHYRWLHHQAHEFQAVATWFSEEGMILIRLETLTELKSFNSSCLSCLSD